MDRRIESGPFKPRDRGAPVTLDFEGDPVRAYAGEPVAVALFASGVDVLARSIKYHRPRAFFCLTGSCAACLMRIDGVPNVRACRTPAREGLGCERQNAYPSASHDALGAIDWFFPKGMDHHTIMTGNRALNLAMQQVVLKLAGLGKLADRPVDSLPEPVRVTPEVLVIGAGPAGLAASTALARAGRNVVLIEQDEMAGGSLLSHPAHGLEAAGRASREARAAGVDLWLGSQAIGYYPEDAGGLFAVARPDRLALVAPRFTVHATGAYPVNALFPGNDRPGIVAGRAVGTLLVRHGVKPGDAVVVLGQGEYAEALTGALEQAGVGQTTRVDGVGETILGVHGRSWIRGVDLGPPEGKRRRRITCDLVAVVTPPSPASELARQQGAHVTLDANRGGFALDTGDDGRTSVANAFACGNVCGPGTIERAAEDGRRIGGAVLSALTEGR
jgi:sarcosine oxidase subunit alpha